MRFLLVTDTHLGIYQSSELYHDVVLNLFKEVVEYGHREGINTVLHLGDFFDVRKMLNTKTQAVAHEIADLFSGDLRMFIALGNHDVYYKNSLEPTTLDIFKHHKWVTVCKSEYTVAPDIHLLPWSIKPTVKKGYLFGHFEFSGFKMNTNFVCDFGEDPVQWKHFKHIYSGHFHWPSTKGNITYLGSSYPQTFHDVDSPRGYHVWEDGKLDFIEYTSAPKFIKMKTDNIDQDLIKNNIVKLIFTEDYGSIKNQKLVDEVHSLSPVKLQTDFSQVKIEGTEETIETADASLLDHPEIMKEYIEKSDLPPFVNKKTLLNMMHKLKESE